MPIWQKSFRATATNQYEPSAWLFELFLVDTFEDAEFTKSARSKYYCLVQRSVRISGIVISRSR
jgi:hypothetical protein